MRRSVAVGDDITAALVEIARRSDAWAGVAADAVIHGEVTTELVLATIRIAEDIGRRATVALDVLEAQP